MLGSPSMKNRSNFKTRPSSSLFQIARGSGATLSEYTFFFEKAHITKKTSSRQTTSRPHDKKNPDRAISEFFYKEPGYVLKNPSTKNQSNFKTRPSYSLFQISRGSGATPRWEYFFLQKAHTTRRSQEALHGFTQKSTRATLVPARQDLEEQDKASGVQP